LENRRYDAILHWFHTDNQCEIGNSVFFHPVRKLWPRLEIAYCLTHRKFVWGEIRINCDLADFL
jgi:hypothetical protein